MKLMVLVMGMILFTAVLFLSVLYQSEWGFTLSIALQVFPIVFARDEFTRRRWFSALWLAWSGIAFVGAGWLQKSEGLQVEAVFKSFGPGYLIMAVLAMVWPKWFYGAPGESSNVDRGNT